MEFKYSQQRIIFEKELNSLDTFVINFTSILNKLNLPYVIISGYVAILFGRSRSSEDIDLILQKIDFNKFKELWEELLEEFECLNTNNPETAYKDYLLQNISIRFSKKGEFLPNMEVKFPKEELDNMSLLGRIEVVLNNHKLYISPLELQIAFKLFLGSNKDIEDARHLYQLFKDHLDIQELQKFNRKLKVEEVFTKRLLWKSQI